VRLRSPRGDDAPFVIASVRIDQRDFQTLHQTDRINASFPVVKTVIDLLNCRPFKNSLRVLERNPVAANVALVLPLVPTIRHRLYLHNVNITRQKPYSTSAMPAERAARRNLASSVASGRPSRKASSIYEASYSVRSCWRAMAKTCSKA